jgi:GT2 family glycosyltransferase
MTRIVIGVPSGDLVLVDFAIALSGLIAHSLARGQIVDLINSRNSLLPRSRHRRVKAAIAQGATHILFLDSDMVFPKNALDLLLNTERDIVGCNYLTRQPPFKPTCRDEDFTPIRLNALTGISEVAYIATGCLLVTMKVFQDIGPPYFDTHYLQATDDWEGEDYHFCRRARAQGYKIHCHHGLSEQIGHIGQRTYRLAMFSSPISAS